MYYSLFNKQLFNNKIDLSNFFPKNVFGIFSTVRRHNKIKSGSIDVHGCIGYWDNKFKNLNNKTLFNNLLRVSHDAVWKDTRNKYFEPIETEPDATLEITYMLNPIYSINKKNGLINKLNTIYSNKKFGIIIQNKDKTLKATYLPEVFVNISWIDIVSSLKKKANINSDNYKLFAYKTTKVKSCFKNILINKMFNYIYIFNFSRFLIDNMKLNLNFPFSYTCKNNILAWNDTDDVRNIATLGDIFKYINLYPNIATREEKKNIKNKILKILQNINQYSSQSLSFLGYIYNLFNINNKYFCIKLLERLPISENEFEKPEIIIGLNKASCNLNYKKYSLTYNHNDSIFKMNWVIQAIISFNKKPNNNLIIILRNKINHILINKKQLETNYIAVSFEVLCFLYSYNKQTEHLKQIYELFFELEQRKDCYNILYSFMNKTSRIDITGHIINGIIQLNKK